MVVINYSEARNRLKQLCDEVRASHEPARIHRKGGDVVMIAAEDWEAIQETLAIASIPGAVERIRGADDHRAPQELSEEGLRKLIEDESA